MLKRLMQEPQLLLAHQAVKTRLKKIEVVALKVQLSHCF